jgi:hypothetical protein
MRWKGEYACWKQVLDSEQGRSIAGTKGHYFSLSHGEWNVKRRLHHVGYSVFSRFIA